MNWSDLSGWMHLLFVLTTFNKPIVTSFSIGGMSTFRSGDGALTISTSAQASDLGEAFNPYRSSILFSADEKWDEFMIDLENKLDLDPYADPFWEQIKLEAHFSLENEPKAGPQIYQGILSHSSLLHAVCSRIANDIETELIPATAIKNIFLETLTSKDEFMIRMDLQAVATRSPSVQCAMDGLLFHNGFHALVCFRVGHRLWRNCRRELAVYMQSTVSRTYSADIHPAASLGSGTYVRVGAGVVIGETAVVGNDVSILEGVTLGGTGKESGDRHPKVGNGVLIMDGGTVLGNIKVEDGSIIGARSIVTKPVPALAIVSGVPATVTGYRSLSLEDYEDTLQEHLARKYLGQWKNRKEGKTMPHR